MIVPREQGSAKQRLKEMSVVASGDKQRGKGWTEHSKEKMELDQLLHVFIVCWSTQALE